MLGGGWKWRSLAEGKGQRERAYPMPLSLCCLVHSRVSKQLPHPPAATPCHCGGLYLHHKLSLDKAQQQENNSYNSHSTAHPRELFPGLGPWRLLWSYQALACYVGCSLSFNITLGSVYSTLQHFGPCQVFLSPLSGKKIMFSLTLIES